MSYRRALSGIAACMALATYTASALALEVKRVSVHLLLSPSGSFSEDIIEMKDFGSWNFKPLSKEISGDERFDSFLVKVRLASSVEVFRKVAGRIEVRSKNTKRVVASRLLGNVYVGEGEAVTAMLVHGHVCEPLILTVIVEKSRVKHELPFECGE
jgi:hypothetical protein